MAEQGDCTTAKVPKGTTLLAMMDFSTYFVKILTFVGLIVPSLASKL